MSQASLGREIIRWAQAQASVRAVVVIGSQARRETAVADEHSDWDFQIVTSQPTLFSTGEWTSELDGGPALAYVIREGRLGSALKVSAVFAEGEIDIVVLPLARAKMARRLVGLGLISLLPSLREGLRGLSVVLRDSYRFEKGELEWGAFYARVAGEITPTRLTDDQVLQLAEGFVCDYVSTLHKIERGEFLAAQRWLHVHLVEVNLCLLHELRQRKGLASFPDGRRLELLSPEASKIGVASTLGSQPLRSATDKAAVIHRELVSELVGERWRWPELPSRLRAK